MRTFLGTVLTVIAVGVLLIAYGLLSPRAQFAANGYPMARPMFASDRLALPEPFAPMQYADPYATYPAYPSYQPYATPRQAYTTTVRTMAVPVTGFPPVDTYAPPRRTTVTRVDRGPHRDWTKTALVIGGSTASGAGLGAIFGGKKGALIGAAIGGGASTLFEATHR